MKLFHQILREAIASSPLNATDLGAKCGVSQTSMSEFTTGKKLPKDDTLVKIAAAFPEAIGQQLAATWVRERLGHKLADAILASTPDSGDALQSMLAALPASTREAFTTLIESALDNSDLRQSLESLASFMRPASPARPHLLSKSEATSSTPSIDGKKKRKT